MPQRPLKFRAWDPESRSMLDEWFLNHDISYVIASETVEIHELTQVHEMHIMQFTGFYDRQGREIYEGDVLLSREEDTGLEDELFEMTYDLGGFCLTDYPRSSESNAYVTYRNWYSSAARHDNPEIPQPACHFDIVGHIHEPLERIEQRVLSLRNPGAIARAEASIEERLEQE